MVDLNDRAVAKIDKADCYTSIASLGKQIQQAWDETQKLDIPTEYGQVSNIVLCGMGGSAYPAYIIKALFNDKLRIPFELVNGYNLPNFVDENTLVLLSSYSGSTEEVLSCAQEAITKKAKISLVATGSDLEEFKKTHNLPGYIFNPVNNPSNQPRLGGGYMIVGFMGILNKLGILTLSGEEITRVVKFLDEQRADIETICKALVIKLEEKIPVITAGEHMTGNAHIIRNQFNETSKNFSSFAILSELNHHLMEGLVHSSKDLVFLFLDSNLYSDRIKKRLKLTKEVVEKNNVQAEVVEILGENKMEQVFYALSLGGFLTFYLAIFYGQDPGVIPWVDFFKEQLEK